jgi:hypothetical protein
MPESNTPYQMIPLPPLIIAMSHTLNNAPVNAGSAVSMTANAIVELRRQAKEH